MGKIEMFKYARKPLEMNTKPGDKILIVADTQTDPLVWEVLMANAYQMNLDPILTLMTPREYEQADPPPALAAAMEKVDLTVLCPSKAMLHSPRCSQMMSSGHRFLAMESVTPEMLTKGGCEEDYPRMQHLAAKLRDIFTHGKRVRVTSQLGTDLTASLEGRPGYVAAGKADPQPNISLLAAAFPDGEAAFAPVEGSGEGIVVFDTTMHFLGRLKSPLKIRVARGKAIGFEGEQAEELQEILKKYGDENSLVFPAEIAVGLNSKITPTGSIRTDKKIYGSVHIAFGMNSDIAGQTDSKIHLDGVIRYPDVMIDEKVIVSSGRIQDI